MEYANETPALATGSGSEKTEQGGSSTSGVRERGVHQVLKLAGEEERAFEPTVTAEPDADGESADQLAYQSAPPEDELVIHWEQLDVDPDEMRPFVEALKRERKALCAELHITTAEYDRYARLLVAISVQETRGGQNWEHNLQRSVGTTKGDTHGLTQLNIGNVMNDPELAPIAERRGFSRKAFREDRERTEKFLYDPGKAAIASMIYAMRNQKMADKDYLNGLKPGVRRFRPVSGYRTMVSNPIFTDTGFLVSETNVRVSTVTYRPNYAPAPGYVPATPVQRPLADIQKDLDRQAPGVYTILKADDGGLVIEKKTKGNGPLDADERFIYAWQSPTTLASGDAQGGSLYLKKIKKTLDKLNDADGVKRGEQDFDGRRVCFGHDGVTLGAECLPTLDAIARAMLLDPGIKVLDVQGHADSVGAADRNLVLSRRRAQVVVDYLVAKGVAAARLRATGFGEARPLIKADPRSGQNRRVEFEVLERGGDEP
jgi:outer membrane protein OmpA-like peptidoglycan-associated protein